MLFPTDSTAHTTAFDGPVGQLCSATPLGDQAISISLREVYLNYLCFGNVNIYPKIDAGISICYKLDALMSYGLNALTLRR